MPIYMSNNCQNKFIFFGQKSDILEAIYTAKIEKRQYLSFYSLWALLLEIRLFRGENRKSNFFSIAIQRKKIIFFNFSAAKWQSYKISESQYESPPLWMNTKALKKWTVFLKHATKVEKKCKSSRWDHGSPW